VFTEIVIAIEDFERFNPAAIEQFLYLVVSVLLFVFRLKWRRKRYLLERDAGNIRTGSKWSLLSVSRRRWLLSAGFCRRQRQAS
jgi:hypothetical protein